LQVGGDDQNEEKKERREMAVEDGRDGVGVGDGGGDGLEKKRIEKE